jgi:ankyrin repeat protein
MSVVLQNLEKYWWCQLDEDALDIPLTEVNQLNVFGEAPIHIAAWKGTAKDLKWLLENGADINQRGEYEMTPLHYAYMGGNRENIDFLINAGADQTLRCDFGLLASDGRPEIR